MSKALHIYALLLLAACASPTCPPERVDVWSFRGEPIILPRDVRKCRLALQEPVPFARGVTHEVYVCPCA